MEKKKKVVVAFSGGLDTSYTVMYLAKEKGYEVIGTTLELFTSSSHADTNISEDAKKL